MNTNRFTALILSFSILFLVGCASDSSEKSVSKEDQKQIEKVDSIGTKLEESSKKVEEDTEEMIKAVDVLLRGI